MGRFNQENNFLYLTASLLVLLFVSPLVGNMPQNFAYWIFKAIPAATILVSYLSLNFGPLWRRFNGALLALFLLSGLLGELFDENIFALADLMIMLVFFLAVAYSASERVLLHGEVDGNKIIGAVAIYLLLGLIWALLYLLALEFSPTAFNGIEYRHWQDNFSTATYFSYVTLTTLGYGDISPAEPFSRVLVFLEAMAGTFYMDVVIASLISSLVNKRNANN